MRLSAGESLVYRHRGDTLAPQPLPGEWRLRHGDWAEFHALYLVLREGDRLTFKQPERGAAAGGHQLLLYVQVAPAGRMVFFTAASCPHCDATELHDAEIPESRHWPLTYLGIPWRRYVLRTCLVCESSWEQECH